MFPETQYTETVFQRWPRLYHEPAVYFGSIRITWVVVVLKAQRDHGGEMGLAHYERPGETTGEGVASVVMEAP